MGLKILGLGFGVQSLGFWVWRLGVGGRDSGYRVQGFGFVQSFEFRVYA